MLEIVSEALRALTRIRAAWILVSYCSTCVALSKLLRLDVPKVLVNHYSHSALAKFFIRNTCTVTNLFDIVYISFVSETYKFVLQIVIQPLSTHPTHSSYVT